MKLFFIKILKLRLCQSCLTNLVQQLWYLIIKHVAAQHDNIQEKIQIQVSSFRMSNLKIENKNTNLLW